MKISIITAVYNSENTIEDAINSIKNQTYNNIEHIIIDGKSTDKSLLLIQQCQHNGMRIFSEYDKGIYDALNKGLSNASGDILGFVHSDDFLANAEVIERIASEFEDPTVEAVYSDLEYVAKTDTSRVVRRWSTGPFHLRRLKWGWMPAHPTLYVRRQVYEQFGNYDLSFEISADYDFILRYFLRAKGKSVYIREVLYKMRVGGISNSKWSGIVKKMREDLHSIRKNRVGGLHTLIFKNLSKVGQFLVHSRRS